MLKPLDFRYALVIEEMDSLRASIVNVLRAQGWLVHGIPRAEQGLHILAHIPYNLVVIDSELPGICGIDFVRILHNSREWRTIRLVIIASSQSADFATQAAECGAFLARKSSWKADLFSFLSTYDEDQTENTVCDQRVRFRDLPDSLALDCVPKDASLRRPRSPSCEPGER
jgi:DNA-binding NtrC family response regulator